MRNVILAVLLVAGCTEAENVSADAPPIGTGHRDAAGADGGDAGGDAVPACNAPVESLNGTATYVKGSATATDPSAAPFQMTGSCGDFVPAHQSLFDGDVPLKVINGGGFEFVSAAPAAGGGCAYTLRFYQPVSGGDLRSACAVSLDYLLVVP